MALATIQNIIVIVFAIHIIVSMALALRVKTMAHDNSETTPNYEAVKCVSHVMLVGFPTATLIAVAVYALIV